MHRDIKLENLMLDQEGYLKIIDFGLAKVLGPRQTTDSVCGTPAYMAPEVIQGEMYRFEAEWWSVGIVLYEMMFGVTPFSSNSVGQL